MIQFDLPKEQSSILKVIGIGGGGGNAVNHMFGQNIEGVNFIICNTDAQALAVSDVPNKIQLGPHLTQGLGAGANPEIGREATEESLEEIRRILEVNTKMAFITAGMGGGTGTGGAPIVAKICKELGILTVGIVTTPFNYEGKKRMAQAQEGLEILKNHVDTLLVISNDKLRHQFGNLTMKAAFAKADNVLATAAKCITDVINSTGQINVDFADVCTVMRNGGVAILGSAECEGEKRAQKAIEQALNSPLLNDNDISGAKWILININSSEGEHEFTMDEVDTIQSYLLSKAGEGSDVILGLGYDNNLGGKIGITLIATGFEEDESRREKQMEARREVEEEKEILELQPVEKKAPSQTLFLFDQDDDAAVRPVAEDKVEEKKEGLCEETIMQAIKKEEANSISEELKPEITPVLQEPKKSILDLSVRDEEDKETLRSDRDVVYFDLEPEEEAVPPVVLHPQSGENRERRDAHIQKPEVRAEHRAPEAKRSANVYVEKAPQPLNTTSVQPMNVAANAETGDDEDMKLVERELREEESFQDEAPQKMALMMPAEEETSEMPDEEEELKRKTVDRINKLRNLSYNTNTADPNNEYETVPAYLRRNLELHNSIANVESFYSNYTVGSDENNKTRISSINAFLHGKKPD